MSDETREGQLGVSAGPEPETHPATELGPAVAAGDATGARAEAPVEDATAVPPRTWSARGGARGAGFRASRHPAAEDGARGARRGVAAEEDCRRVYDVAGRVPGARRRADPVRSRRGLAIGTRTDLAPWIKKLDFYEHHRHLSRPTMETLAIIAYKQPVTRAEIEAIRGVNVERIVRNLLERKLVKILGHGMSRERADGIGTTREFLDLVGRNLADLLGRSRISWNRGRRRESTRKLPCRCPPEGDGRAAVPRGSEGAAARHRPRRWNRRHSMDNSPKQERGAGRPRSRGRRGDPAADTNGTGLAPPRPGRQISPLPGRCASRNFSPAAASPRGAPRRS